MRLLDRIFCTSAGSWPRTPLEDASFVVVDVETTGLDSVRDELLSIGLVPVGPQGIDIGGMREIFLHHESEVIDKENLVIHGITPTESARGRAADDALREFVKYVEGKWLVAFHADFDRSVLTRATNKHLGASLANPFLDLAWLLPALFPESAHSLRTLDDWLGRFGIAAPARHRAAADALATAELLLVALAEARRRQPHRDVRALARIARAQGQLAFMSHT